MQAFPEMLKWQFNKYNLITSPLQFLSATYENPAVNVNSTLPKEGIISPLQSAAKPAEQRPQAGVVGLASASYGVESAPVQILAAGAAGLAEAGIPRPHLAPQASP